MKRFLRGPLIYIIILFLILLTSGVLGDFSGGVSKDVSYQAFLQLAKDDQIEKVSVTELTLVGLKKGTSIKETDFPGQYDFKTLLPSLAIFNQDLATIQSEKTGTPAEQISSLDVGFTIEYKAPATLPWWVSFLPYVIILVVFGFMFYSMMQQTQGGGKGGVMSFGKSRARLSTPDQQNVTFKDVAGADEEKEELEEVVQFLKSPDRFLTLGARIPKGILLIGPPGCGKTLLAKAVAGEAGVPFYSISGSDFVEMFVGVGASRVRDLFETAKKSAPSIVFIDEIDAVGRQRGAGMGGGHDEREQTLNQLLVEMDGFAVNEGIIVIAATNRRDILDPALMRPGRFDRQILVHYPDVKGREEVLKVHARGKPMDPNVDLQSIARMTVGFTGADLENVLNEAAILTARQKGKLITGPVIEAAIMRVVVGPEKKTRVITQEDKRITAYHEAGHAILAKVLPKCDPVHEISIIPRGPAAGYTLSLPDKDRSHQHRSRMLDELAMTMGGRAAEQVVFGDVTTGASQDLKHATELARSMVVEYGMSDAIGNIYLGAGEEVFLGRDFSHQRTYSEAMSAKIDSETKLILDQAYQRALEVVRAHRDAMERVVVALMEKEKLTAAEFDALVDGQPLPEAQTASTPLPQSGTPGVGEFQSASVQSVVTQQPPPATPSQV